MKRSIVVSLVAVVLHSMVVFAQIPAAPSDFVANYDGRGLCRSATGA